jgi:hypothetical protein
MHKSILMLLALALAGCPGEGLSNSSTQNPNFQVAFLFEHEGCRVFRFEDAGRERYFVKCVNGQASTETMQPSQCGKTQCPYPETIPTR